ncbi:MAG: hypothetical protein HZA61_01775 [Candidatus Eisenbacteria bacterium]|uniref:PLD phosphodiesterase domain-containing protein n=1 Tax=Eiseniibacteriota bacterium TaxID=2212470 RepID=A0A933W9B1_UNCEI|nr:hypothetical protein [Candidatus Eisenbacteria bacterium]
MTPELRAAVVDFARQVTPETLDRLADELGGDASGQEAQPERIGARFADPHVRHAVVRLLATWSQRAPETGSMLAESLRTMAAASRWRDEHERVDLVWSGPRSGEALRRSDEALLQVVHAARHRLSIVTFAAYRIESVAAALREALARGVTVRFFGETESQSDGRLSRDAAAALGRSLADRIEIYEWPRDRRPADASGRRGLLHAKFALADESVLFVSSANLTEAALDANMELGVLLTGGRAPVAARAHLDQLIAEGVLRLSVS